MRSFQNKQGKKKKGKHGGREIEKEQKKERMKVTSGTRRRVKRSVQGRIEQMEERLQSGRKFKAGIGIVVLLLPLSIRVNTRPDHQDLAVIWRSCSLLINSVVTGNVPDPGALVKSLITIIFKLKLTHLFLLSTKMCPSNTMFPVSVSLSMAA